MSEKRNAAIGYSATVLSAVLFSIKGIIANRIGTALTSDLRGQLVEKLQGLAVDFYDRHPAGVLVSRVEIGRAHV